MIVLRYPTTRVCVSSQDPLADILDWLSFLTARDYLTSLLQAKHRLPSSLAASRAKQIIPHVRMAMAFTRQSLSGPVSISFLPAYYAMLNLMKVCVLVGPRHAQLASERWHGATYNGVSKDSHSILTEFITIKSGGVFPLFYETITGSVLTTKRQIRIQMKDIIPFVVGVGHEYQLATGEPHRLAAINFSVQQSGGKTRHFARVHPPDGDPTTLPRITSKDLPVLRGYKAVAGDPGSFVGSEVKSPDQQEWVLEARSHLRTHLIYQINEAIGATPLCSRRLQLPEELPVALLFFYMSSVVRYKPEFFARLQDSRFWPFVAATRRHSFHSFLLAFWSFMQQENCVIRTSHGLAGAALE